MVDQPRTYPALDLTFPGGLDLCDRVSVALDDLQPAAIHQVDEEVPPRWRVFFATPAARTAAREVLDAAFGRDSLGVGTVDVPDEDWAARTQAALPPIRIGRITVAPPWDVPDAGAGDDHIVVVIEPSMGFGTGHHESTRLCLELLQAQPLRGCRVLDVGTGSGVLAIAAARLGAREATGIDDDQDAIDNARENGALNSAGPAGGAFTQPVFETVDLRTFEVQAPPYDVVLANLTGALLANAAGRLAALVRPGGTIIVAGFQSWEADGVLTAFVGHAQVAERRVENGWEAARLVRWRR